MDTEKGIVDTKAAAPVTTSKPEPAKRDMAAAGELPQLFKDLAAARAVMATLTDGRMDVHTISMNIGGTPCDYHPGDREAIAKAVTADMQAKVTTLESKIKELGFDPA